MLVHGVTASTRTWWRVGPWFAGNGWRDRLFDLFLVLIGPDEKGLCYEAIFT